MNDIVKVATTIFHTIKPDSDIVVKYDRIEDVLHIDYTDSPVQKAGFGGRFGDYIVRVKQGRVIGVTILNAQRHFERNFSDKPPILTRETSLINLQY
jgi:uncharacterized protein YuzE